MTRPTAEGVDSCLLEATKPVSDRGSVGSGTHPTGPLALRVSVWVSSCPCGHLHVHLPSWEAAILPRPPFPTLSERHAKHTRPHRTPSPPLCLMHTSLPAGVDTQQKRYHVAMERHQPGLPLPFTGPGQKLTELVGPRFCRLRDGHRSSNPVLGNSAQTAHCWVQCPGPPPAAGLRRSQGSQGLPGSPPRPQTHPRPPRPPDILQQTLLLSHLLQHTYLEP